MSTTVTLSLIGIVLGALVWLLWAARRSGAAREQAEAATADLKARDLAAAEERNTEALRGDEARKELDKWSR